jgi:hypothetical protein
MSGRTAYKKRVLRQKPRKCVGPVAGHVWSIPDGNGKRVCLFCDQVSFVTVRAPARKRKGGAA